MHPLLLLLLLVSFSTIGDRVRAQEAGSSVTALQGTAVAGFLAERANWQPLCLYTFGISVIGNGATVADQVPGDVCPFGALRPDNELVTSLNTAATFSQLGVHLAEDTINNSRRVQLSSVSTVSARDFFAMAAVRNDTMGGAGVTFEMVLRRREETNRSMTLFSIANEFDNCVDPGFRLDMNEHQVLAFIYFLPMLEEGGQAGVEACYEQRLFSVDSSAACQLPSLVEPVENTPPVQLTVTLDPSSDRGHWKTAFYMSYTDVNTKQRVDCEVHDEQHPPNTQVLNNLIEGRYRLYLGNSPRNVSSPRERKHLAPARAFRPLGNTDKTLNATERLRFTLKQKLMSIQGPRLPKAMRIFGDDSFSLQVLGITFPPLSEDTPFAYLRSKLTDFKEKYGDQIVDYLVNQVQVKSHSPMVVQQSQGSPSRSQDRNETGENAFSRAELFQNADGASFDLFQFAIYRRVVSKEQVAAVSRQWLLPTRQFPARTQTLRISEDSVVLLNLTMLHSVFNDLRLELREIPEFGQLLLFPNQTVVTPDNMNVFRELPLEFQHQLFFRPARDQSNDNIPLPNPVAFSRRLQPYATVVFGIAESLDGRIVNTSESAVVEIFVNAVNDAPRPRKSEEEYRVERDLLIALDLKGDDVDGAPPPPSTATSISATGDFLSSLTFSNATTPITGQRQSLKIVRLPRFGKLFDCNASCDKVMTVGSSGLGSLEPFRIHRNATKSENATSSTSLMYIYRGWGQGDHGGEANAKLVVDELWYQLSDGDPGVFSDVAKVKFVLERSSSNHFDTTVNKARSNVVAVVQLQEDSLHLLNLSELEPLVASFSSQTQYKVTTLPKYGGLYQYTRHSSDCNEAGEADRGNSTRLPAEVSLACVGRRVTVANATVTDPLGSIFYVPQLHYFNVQSNPSFARVPAADFFEYQVVNLTHSSNGFVSSVKSRFVNGSEVRRIELEVVNIPDALVVLPPTVFKANSTNEDGVSTPIAFEDPDDDTPGIMYQVNLQATDGTSEFELGFVITDDDVMTECPFERPCTLTRSTNGSRLNSSSSDIGEDSELQFHITTQLYDASHVQVTGTRAALTTGLAALVFRDLSRFSGGDAHTTAFTLWVQRVDGKNGSDADSLQVETSFTVTFPADKLDGSSSDEDLLSVLTFQLDQYVGTLLVLGAGWLVLANASCCSTGFCCCCSKARKKRWAKFEQRRQLFQAQVAQNDHEYSVLLMDLADLLKLEPDLLVSTCLLHSCASDSWFKEKKRGLIQAFCLWSLLPLLESERQGTRFIFRLLTQEYADGMAVMSGGRELFQSQEFLAQSSTASRALACFCRHVGTKWLSELLAVEVGDTNERFLESADQVLDVLLGRLNAQVDRLPVEIVILCRACVKLFQPNSEHEVSRAVQLNAAHLVFFNHFLGPALEFSREEALGFLPSTQQQEVLRGVAYKFVGLSRQWGECDESSCSRTKSSRILDRGNSSESLLGAFTAEHADSTTRRETYEYVLETICSSSSVASSYDPSDVIVDVDCELMAMCLTNVHSVLDSYWPAFRRKLEHTQTNVEMEQTENAREHMCGRLTRLTRLLKALSFPLANIHVLVEHARSDLLDDSLLWNGFSSREWGDRAAQQQASPLANRRSHIDTRCTDPTEGLGVRTARSLLAFEEEASPNGILMELEDRSPSPLDVDWLASDDSGLQLIDSQIAAGNSGVSQ
ncbi:hypothetical protein BBJ28_00013497 [Nothophytophthora sp. Chile5]|nr:hypothetical protein BBJ28_00013497 [Nothophytophthora sp. Chile5]